MQQSVSVSHFNMLCVSQDMFNVCELMCDIGFLLLKVFVMIYRDDGFSNTSKHVHLFASKSISNEWKGTFD
jgi:hypothetical protein